MTNQEQKELEELCQKMLDIGKQQCGARWDNRHPTYCEIYAAFRSGDLEEARRIWSTYYC